MQVNTSFDNVSATLQDVEGTFNIFSAAFKPFIDQQISHQSTDIFDDRRPQIRSEVVDGCVIKCLTTAKKRIHMTYDNRKP